MGSVANCLSVVYVNAIAEKNGILCIILKQLTKIRYSGFVLKV